MLWIHVYLFIVITGFWVKRSLVIGLNLNENWVYGLAKALFVVGQQRKSKRWIFLCVRGAFGLLGLHMALLILL